jgi:hypothetical protein
MKWTVERIEIGMGEVEYNIYRCGVFMCHTDDHSKALFIMSVMERDEQYDAARERFIASTFKEG